MTDGGERDRECGRLEQPAGKREADRGGQPPGARSDALDVFEEVLQSIGDPGLDRRRVEPVQPPGQPADRAREAVDDDPPVPPAEADRRDDRRNQRDGDRDGDFKALADRGGGRVVADA